MLEKIFHPYERGYPTSIIHLYKNKNYQSAIIRDLNNVLQEQCGKLAVSSKKLLLKAIYSEAVIYIYIYRHTHIHTHPRMSCANPKFPHYNIYRPHG